MTVYDIFIRMVIDLDVNDNNFAGITFNQFRIAKHIYKTFKNLKKLR